MLIHIYSNHRFNIMVCLAIFVVTLLSCHHLFVHELQCTQKLSEKEDAKLKLLNRSSINMMQVGAVPMIKGGIVTPRHLLKPEQTETTNRPNTFLAVARTKSGKGKYAGGGCEIKSDNPKATGQQYTSARIRLQGGHDTIEAGWRAGKTHCFNKRCPGFIQTYDDFDLEGPADGISPPGGPAITLPCYIERNDANGNWELKLGNNRTVIGHWPSHIFTGLRGLADRIEWGGAAYSPPGTPLPPMGSGKHPIGSSDWDGTLSNIRVLNERGQTVERFDVETYADNSKLYSVRDEGYVNKHWGHVIFYGGPGHL